MPTPAAPLPATTDFVPSTPDPQTVKLVMSLLRHLLTLASGAGIMWAAGVSDSMLLLISSAIVGAAGIVWSLWEKYQAARADHAGSVRSAQLASPVRAI